MNDILEPDVASADASLLVKFTRLVREDAGGLHLRLSIVNMLAGLLPPAAANQLRVSLYRRIGFAIGDGTLFRGRPRLNGAKNLYTKLKIGRFCLIDVHCSFDLQEQITIGDQVTIGHEAMILTSSHEIGTKELRAGRLFRAPVVIEDGAWIGPRSIILPKVTIGAGAVVAAGSLVNKDVAAHTYVAGTPAKVIEKLA